MKPTDFNNLLTGIDLGEIVRTSLRSAHEEVLGEPVDIAEAYVAVPKPFRQVTEFTSQDTKDAHDELYKGYVESLNSVSAELDVVDLSTPAGRLKFADLKKQETALSNAVNLHELFFANCFDPQSELFQDMLVYIRLQADWGDFNRWQMDFQNVGLTGPGNGWVVCGYSLYHKRYLNIYVCAHSKDVLTGFIPIVVVDMWEHSYYRDYLNDKKSYLVAMMRELNWEVIEERTRRIDTIAKLMK